MAPRTREQQDEYNRKRRQENAAKKAGAGPSNHAKENVQVVEPTREASRERLAGKVNAERKVVGYARTAPLHDAAFYGKHGKTVEDAKKDLGRTPPQRKAKLDPKLVTRTFKWADPTGKKMGLIETTPKPVAAKSKAPATPVAKKPALPPRKLYVEPTEAPKASSRIPNATMALSYQRNGAPGGGMQRGKNFQATVTFTPEQFAELRDRALFNNRSLAEQIRWCCTNK